MKDLTWQQKEDLRLENQKLLKQLIVAEAKRVIQILEENMDEDLRSAEVCNKLKEIRRDSMTLERNMFRREY